MAAAFDAENLSWISQLEVNLPLEELVSGIGESVCGCLHAVPHNGSSSYYVFRCGRSLHVESVVDIE